MKRSVTAITLGLALAATLVLPPSVAAQPDRTYQRYAKVRDQMKACAIDGQWRHLSATKRKQCRRLRRRYSLWSYYGTPGATFIRCKTSRCPTRPRGVPDTRGRAPRDAVRMYG